MIIVDENGNANISIEAGNPALMVTPDPNLRFGEYRDQIHTIVNKFNSGSRKDALRDLCELGEHMTDKLINKALRKHYFKTTVTQANIDAMNWESTINTLGSHNQCISGTLPIFDSVLKTDMISFKNGRNLVDHQVRTARERRERELQFADRATLGLRLCSKLVSIIRRT